MLLVTFHGGSTNSSDSASATSNSGSGGKPINNIYGYSTKDGTLETKAALHGVPSHVKLDELRGMAVYDGKLYVVNGSKTHSYVFVFSGPPKSGPEFDYLDTVIGAGQSIMHPFAVAFDPSAPNCYVSDQDSNVVAQVNLTVGKHGAVAGTLGKDCQSKFLKGKYPSHKFLDGTFVASQKGDLVGVKKVAPDVSAANGGLGVKGSGKPLAPSNSVRDVAIANGILFVCDEVDKQINMYNLTDGTFLGASPSSGSGSLNGNVPTHLAINGGVWVSADANLYWSALPASASGASLSFRQVTILTPSNNKIGGISFDDSGNVYVIFQQGTGGTGSGTIEKYAVTAGSPPSLSQGTTFATCKDDTPEFCMWVSDSNWPS
jgi:hypothetical protein